MDTTPTPGPLTMAEVISRGGISGGDGSEDDSPDEDSGPEPLEILDAAAIEVLEPEQLRDLITAAEVEIASLAEGGLAARRRRNELYSFRNACAGVLNEITAEDGTPPEIVDVVVPDAPASESAPTVEDSTEPPTEVLDDATPPVDEDSPVGDPVLEGDAPDITEDEDEQILVGAAPIVAAIGTQMAGQPLDQDQLHTLVASIWDNPGGGSAVIGRFDQVEPDTPRLGTHGPAANDAILGGIGEERRARIASICATPDIRREIPECGDDAEPIRAIFAQFPSDNMTIEYHTEEALSVVAGGTGTWTSTERDAYDTAVTNGDADAILAAQKVCYLVDCNTATLATALPVYACVEHTLETQYSHPQQIASVERRVRRRLARVKETVLLDFVRAESFHFNVDADLFGLRLSSVLAVGEALRSIMGSVVVEERIDGANYTAIVPWGFPTIFDLDGASAPDCCAALGLTDFGVTNVVSTKDNFTGAAEPFSPLVRAGDGYFADNAVATRGPANPSEVENYPQDNWWIALVDTSSWFYFSPFNFTLGATRDDVHVRGNKTRSMFIEGAHGLARNGCQPSVWVNLENVCAAGVRALPIAATCESGS